jgi:hypothetical protein
VSSTPYWLDEDARPATEPLAEQLFPRPHYARRGFDYWQQLPDGRLIAGGRRNTTLEAENTAVEETTEVIQVQIEELVRELLGRLPRITHRWAGLFGTTADRLPLVGPVPGRDGVWVAAGYSGHGNVMGLACGARGAGHPRTTCAGARALRPCEAHSVLIDSGGSTGRCRRTRGQGPRVLMVGAVSGRLR